MQGPNRQILLVSRPTGWPTPDNFRLVECAHPPLAHGQVRVRNHWLSLDPYMRGRMNAARSYAEPQALDAVMIGGTAGEVVESRNARFAPGAKVVGRLGWQSHGVDDGTGLRIVDDTCIPLQAYLGVVGMPGVTAWYGLNEICRPQTGETLAVTAASGAVGSVVGQLAKQRGCRVIGVAGGEAKCRYAVEELGFDACVDHKAGRLREDIEAAAPQGIDCLFENVGGEIFDTLLTRLNPFARIALCGLVSQYNARAPYPVQNLAALLTQRVRLQGFIVSEHLDRWPAALAELGQGVAEGWLRYRESVVQGLEQAPQALIGLLRGENFGKQLVRLVP